MKVSSAKRIAHAGLLTTMAITHPLWTGSKRIAPYPAFDWADASPVIHQVLSGFIVVWVIYGILNPGGAYNGLVMLILIVGAILMDMNRCQFWLLHYLYVVLLPDKLTDDETALAILSMIAVTYIFSGLQKFNTGFESETVPWLVAPFGLTESYLLPVIIPVIEILLGVCLLVPWICPWTSACGVIMHALIIFILVHHSWNLSVIPWNVILILYHVQSAISGGLGYRFRYFKVAPFIGVFLVVTVLGFFGFINRAFSFPLYSGDQYSGIIVLEDAMLEELPPDLKDLVEEIKTTREPFINLDRYAIHEMGTPLFQDIGAFKCAARSFIPYAHEDDDFVLLVRNGTEFIFEKDLWAFTRDELELELK